MSKAGDISENPVTGERAIVRIGTEDTNGERIVVDLYIQPGGAVMGEHVHAVIEERFMVLEGKVGFRLNGKESVAEKGMTLLVSPGIPHDWWNAGIEVALVRVEISPATRFEIMIQNAFGLAQDGQVNKKGMPNPFQLVLFAQEFEDVVTFTKPPRIVQKIMFGVLSPIARLLGYKGSYPEYLTRPPSAHIDIEPLHEDSIIPLI